MIGFFIAVVSISLLGVNRLDAASVGRTEYEFSKLRHQKVIVADDGEVLKIEVQFLASRVFRPAVARAVHSAEARMLTLLALSRHLNVPNAREFVLQPFPEIQLDNSSGDILGRLSVKRSEISVREATSEGTSSEAMQSVASTSESLDSGTPRRQPYANEKKQRTDIPVTISKEISDMLPKVPGSRSEAPGEYKKKAALYVEELCKNWPHIVETPSDYQKLIESSGKDLDEIGRELKKSVTNDTRLLGDEVMEICNSIDVILGRAIEQLLAIGVK